MAPCHVPEVDWANNALASVTLRIGRRARGVPQAVIGTVSMAALFQVKKDTLPLRMRFSRRDWLGVASGPEPSSWRGRGCEFDRAGDGGRRGEGILQFGDRRPALADQDPHDPYQGDCSSFVAKRQSRTVNAGSACAIESPNALKVRAELLLVFAKLLLLACLQSKSLVKPYSGQRPIPVYRAGSDI